MDFKELRELFHEKDREFSSYFYKIDYSKDINGIKRLSWRKVILAWFLVMVMFSIIMNISIILYQSDYSTNNEGINSNIGSFKPFSNSYFSIDYPADFIMKEDSDYTLFRNYDYNRWIEISESNFGYSLSNRVNNAVKNINSGEGRTIGQPKPITVDGFKGYEIRATYPTGAMTEIFVEKNGHIFNLRFSNIDDNTKNLVINSFKFK